MNIERLLKEPGPWPKLYHRFYLSTVYGEVNVVHTTYKVHRRTPCGAWVREAGHWGEDEKWVADCGTKKWAYPDVDKAWDSFKIRMLRRALHARHAANIMNVVSRSLGQDLEPPKSSVRLDNDQSSLWPGDEGLLE